MRPLELAGKTAGALRQTLSIVLAGGQGERLYPLTRDRAKPAVPFAGSYRLIDFTLSNCLNSGIRRIHVLTQYKSDSLNRHVRLGWNIFNPEIGEYIEVNPPQMRLTSHWYLGTADAIHQNIYTLERERPTHVLILSGDHVYKMDYCRMLRQHVEKEADLTIACLAIPCGEASRLGVLTTDEDMRALELAEKPQRPTPIPGTENRGKPMALCSMGVYIFNTKTLVRRVVEDSKRSTSHDFAKDVIPAMIEKDDRVFGYRFKGVESGGSGFWRDVGTLDIYWQTHMELVGGAPPIDLHDEGWPLRTYAHGMPPVKSMCTARNRFEQIESSCQSQLHNVLVSDGCVVDCASIKNSVLGRGVHVAPGVEIEGSVIMQGVKIGENARIRQAVIDKHNEIPAGYKVGIDPEQDHRHFSVSDGGIVVVPKEMPLFRPDRKSGTYPD